MTLFPRITTTVPVVEVTEVGFAALATDIPSTSAATDAPNTNFAKRIEVPFSARTSIRCQPALSPSKFTSTLETLQGRGLASGPAAAGCGATHPAQTPSR